MLCDAFARPTECGESPERRGTPSLAGQPFCEIAGRFAVAHETNDPRTMREMRHKTFDRRGVKSKADDRFEAPPEPRRGQREGRRRRMRNPLAGFQLLGKACAGAIPERIAGGEDGRRATAAAQHDLRIERHRPRTTAAGHARKREMTLAAEDGFGPGKRVSACLR